MSLVSALIALPRRVGRNVTLASLANLDIIQCFALVIHGLSEWFYFKHLKISVRGEKPITTRAVIGSLATLEETLGVTLTHGDRFDLPNSTCLVEDRLENVHDFPFLFGFMRNAWRVLPCECIWTCPCEGEL